MHLISVAIMLCENWQGPQSAFYKVLEVPYKTIRGLTEGFLRISMEFRNRFAILQLPPPSPRSFEISPRAPKKGHSAPERAYKAVKGPYKALIRPYEDL
jgi:hypothetical protein